jgi:hypothetical protein
MPGFTAESGMIAGGGPDGTIARRRRPLWLPPPDTDADADALPGAAFDVPASKSNPSAVRTAKKARRTKP